MTYIYTFIIHTSIQIRECTVKTLGISSFQHQLSYSLHVSLQSLACPPWPTLQAVLCWSRRPGHSQICWQITKRNGIRNTAHWFCWWVLLGSTKQMDVPPSWLDTSAASPWILLPTWICRRICHTNLHKQVLEAWKHRKNCTVEKGK